MEKLIFFSHRQRREWSSYSGATFSQRVLSKIVGPYNCYARYENQYKKHPLEVAKNKGKSIPLLRQHYKNGNGTGNENFCKWKGTSRWDRTDRSKRTTSRDGPNIPVGPNRNGPFHLTSTRNSRNFWLNGKHPWGPPVINFRTSSNSRLKFH